MKSVVLEMSGADLELLKNSINIDKLMKRYVI